MIRSLLRFPFFSAFVLFAGGCRHPGMMFLNLTVVRGGEPLAEIRFDASDSSDVDEIWAEAEGPAWGEIFPEALLQAEIPSAQQPQEARLRGALVLSIKHGDFLQSQVTLDGVVLVRGAEDDSWGLSAADVARARRAALR